MAHNGVIVKVARWSLESNGVQTKGVDDLYMALGKEGVDQAIKQGQVSPKTGGERRKKYKPLAVAAPKPEAKQVQKNLIPNGPWPTQIEGNALKTAVSYLYSDSADWIAVGGILYVWAGNHYQARPDDAEYPRIQCFCDQFYTTDPETGREDYPLARANGPREILQWQKMSCLVTSGQINPPGVNCTNGVLELHWDERLLIPKLVEHDPKRHLYLSQPQVTYDPDADSTEYERLMACLDPEPREIWERTIAVSLDLATVRRFKGRAIRALLLKGDGANGKDTIRMATEMILGSGAMSSCSATDFKEYDAGRAFPLYPLRGKLVNWPSENADVGRIDQLRGLRAAITGDKITFEQKHKDPVNEAPKAVFLFNINEAPQIVAQLKATASRWGVVPFTRTYSENPSGGELQADPRFKEDPEFIQREILPAFLNRLLVQLQNVVNEGIDYSATRHVLEEIQRESSHLLQFAQDTGLEADPNGSVTVVELWEKLKRWYTDNGTLTIENGARGGQKVIWQDQPSKSDRNVKGQNQVVARFLEIFPKVTKIVHRESDGKTQTLLHGILFVEKLGSVGSAGSKVSQSKGFVSEPSSTSGFRDPSKGFREPDKRGKPEPSLNPVFELGSELEPRQDKHSEPSEPTEPSFATKNITVGTMVKYRGRDLTICLGKILEVCGVDRGHAEVSYPGWHVRHWIPTSELEVAA